MPGHDTVTRNIAAKIMQDEHLRSRGGFSHPSSIQPPLDNASIYNIPDPSSNNIRNTSQQKVNTSHFTAPSATAPPPPQQLHTTAQNRFNPAPPTFQNVIPSCAPPANIPTNQFAGFDPNSLGQFIQMVQFMANTASPQASASSRDPETKMAKNLEDLRANPVQFQAGLDDRCENLHDARFAGGAVCLLQKYWLDARERLGLAGVTPLSGYDFETVGIAGSITSKGLWEMHNPANPHLKLKYFSSSNVGSASLSSRRITLAENDQAVDINESLRDLVHMADFKAALGVVTKAMTIVLHWNHSVSAIHGFMENSNYCHDRTRSWPDRERASELTAFVDHIFHTNSRKWVAKQHFLSAPELRTAFESWLGSRPASRTSLVAAAAPAAEAQLKTDGQKKQWTRAKNWYNNKSGSGGSGNNNNFSSGNYSAGSSSSGPDLCKRYNAGFCKNAHDSCTTGANGSGSKLLHKCSYRSRNTGRVCKENHPECKHNFN